MLPVSKFREVGKSHCEEWGDPRELRVCAIALHCTGLHPGQIKSDVKYLQWYGQAELGGPNHTSDVKVEKVKVARACGDGTALRGRYGNRTD